MEIIIGGDLCPTKSNEQMFETKGIDQLLNEDLKEIWLKSNFRILNLEVPLCNPLNPIDKCGPNLYTNPKTIMGIASLKPSLLLLSNNHVMDYGTEGLQKTIALLEKEKINYIGVGENLFKTKNYYIINCNNMKIGIYNCCEHEFSVATPNSCGANPLDYKTLYEIKTLKDQTDHVIVIFHGGKEFYRYPTPNLQKICRYFCDFGANLVICQHSHCIGCLENYNDCTIVYGQGNFIFDDCYKDYCDTSLLIKLNITNEFTIEYIPIIRNNETIALASDEQSKKTLKDFYNRTEEIKSKIMTIYDEYSKEKRDEYLSTVMPTNLKIKILKRIFKKNIFLKYYNKKKILKLINIIECESHRELLVKILKDQIK